MNFSNTKIMLLSALLFVVFVCAGLLWLVVSIHRDGLELAGYTKIIADQLVQEQAFSELRTLAADTQKQRTDLADYVLQEGETISFLADMEKAAVANGVMLETESLEVLEQDGLFDTLRVNFKIDGTVERVEVMLDIMETIPYHSSVEKFTYLYNEASKQASVVVVVDVSLTKS